MRQMDEKDTDRFKDRPFSVSLRQLDVGTPGILHPRKRELCSIDRYAKCWNCSVTLDDILLETVVNFDNDNMCLLLVRTVRSVNLQQHTFFDSIRYFLFGRSCAASVSLRFLARYCLVGWGSVDGSGVTNGRGRVGWSAWLLLRGQETADGFWLWWLFVAQTL